MADPLAAGVEMKVIGVIGVVFRAQRYVKNLTRPLTNIAEKLSLGTGTEVMIPNINPSSIDKREPRYIRGATEGMFAEWAATPDPTTRISPEGLD